MGRGRPPKPSALKRLEGDRSKGRPIPDDLPLHGTPELPGNLDGLAAEHFTFLAAEFGSAGVLKRADSPALAKLADLWSAYWRASGEGDVSAMCKLSQRWDAAASKLGLSPIDRSRLMMVKQQNVDETEERFFKVTG